MMIFCLLLLWIFEGFKKKMYVLVSEGFFFMSPLFCTPSVRMSVRFALHQFSDTADPEPL